MPSLPERLREKWVKEGVTVRPGATFTEVEVFESRYGVCFPLDLRDYFMTCDGVVRGDWDDDCLEFLNLGEVKSVAEDLADFRGIPDYGNIVNTLPDYEYYFVIVDYLITSHVYAIRLYDDASTENPIVGISGDSYWMVANSFTEFGEKYLLKGLRGLL